MSFFFSLRDQIILRGFKKGSTRLLRLSGAPVQKHILSEREFDGNAAHARPPQKSGTTLSTFSTWSWLKDGTRRVRNSKVVHGSVLRRSTRMSTQNSDFVRSAYTRTSTTSDVRDTTHQFATPPPSSGKQTLSDHLQQARNSSPRENICALVRTRNSHQMQRQSQLASKGQEDNLMQR